MPISGFRKAENVEKWADFVGDSREDNEGAETFKNRIIGSLDLINQPSTKTIADLNFLYKTVGRDDSKIMNLRSKGQDVDTHLFPIGHLASAETVLIGKMSKENPPKFFIDGWGNIWAKEEKNA